MDLSQPASLLVNSDLCCLGSTKVQKNKHSGASVQAATRKKKDAKYGLQYGYIALDDS